MCAPSEPGGPVGGRFTRIIRRKLGFFLLLPIGELAIVVIPRMSGTKAKV